METINFNNGIYTIDLENGTYFCRLYEEYPRDIIPIMSDGERKYFFDKTSIFRIKECGGSNCLLNCLRLVSFGKAFGETFTVNAAYFNLIGV